MSPARRCSRTACRRPAIATLTYVYGDQTAVLGPLATYAEPHAYDLCDEHSERLSAPRGWEVMRLAPDPDAMGPSTDDLLALADAVREAARPAPPVPPVSAVHGQAGQGGHGGPAGRPDGPDRPGHPAPESGRRGHLRVLRPLAD